jgi:hypothetical protein
VTAAASQMKVVAAKPIMVHALKSCSVTV